MCLLCNVQQAKPSLAGSAHSKEGSCESIAAAAAEKVAPLPKEKKGFFFFFLQGIIYYCFHAHSD